MLPWSSLTAAASRPPRFLACDGDEPNCARVEPRRRPADERPGVVGGASSSARVANGSIWTVAGRTDIRRAPKLEPRRLDMQCNLSTTSSLCVVEGTSGSDRSDQ